MYIYKCIQIYIIYRCKFSYAYNRVSDRDQWARGGGGNTEGYINIIRWCAMRTIYSEYMT